MTFGGGSWDNADPDIAFDKPADRIEAPELNAKLEAPANPLGLL